MSKLTKEERKWISEVQEILSRCPSERLGFYTVGDPQIYVYNKEKDAGIYRLLDGGGVGDFCQAVAKMKAGFCDLTFPSCVHSTAG